MIEKKVERYKEFLEERMSSNKIDSLTLVQKSKLIACYESFKLGEQITTELGETICLSPTSEQTVENYIHHYLIKYNNGIDWYSDKYLDLYAQIEDTIKNHEERILYFSNNSFRICYIRKYKPASKRPYHIFISHLTVEGQIIGWTHFDAKEGYLKSLKENEKKLIAEHGLRDSNGMSIIVKNYEEYCSLKRKTLLYLGSSALFKRIWP